MYQPPLLSLSPELVLLVCDKLQLRDVKQLRLCCRAIGGIADRPALRNIRIRAEGCSLDEALSYLQLLAQSPARYSAQNIDIGNLSSLSPSNADGNGSDGFEISSVSRGKEDICQMIMDVMGSLTAVRSVRKETIWTVIQSFSALRHLSIRTQWFKFYPTFDGFTHLESISIDANSRSETSWIYPRLSKLYTSCSTLTSLLIWDRSRMPSLTEANNLDQIFLGCPQNMSSSRLRHLCLHDCFFVVNNITGPHLRQLTSLELVCSVHDDWEWNADDYGNPCNIWSSFIGSGIQLEELVHNTTPDSLIDYLSSYSGLKKLRLSVSQYSDSSSSNKAAVRFFDTVLPNHADTLETLGLDVWYEGKWCLTIHNAALIAKCLKLNHLLISIISNESSPDDIYEYRGAGEEDGEFNEEPHMDTEYTQTDMVKHLLDTTIHLPLINHVSLMACLPEVSRTLLCGHSGIRHCQATRQEIADKVMKYRFPLLCQYIPKVEVARRGTFESVRDLVDGRLRYERVLG